MTYEDEILRCAQDDRAGANVHKWAESCVNLSAAMGLSPGAQRSFASLRMTERGPMFINGLNCGIDDLFSA